MSIKVVLFYFFMYLMTKHLSLKFIPSPSNRNVTFGIRVKGSNP